MTTTDPLSGRNWDYQPFESSLSKFFFRDAGYHCYRCAKIRQMGMENPNDITELQWNRGFQAEPQKKDTSKLVKREASDGILDWICC